MGLFAMAVNTGSVAQDGGLTTPGLDFTQISQSGMTDFGTGPGLTWSDYRPLAKGRQADELNIFLLASELDNVVKDTGAVVPQYWEDVASLPAAISGTLGLESQRPYYLPRYKTSDPKQQANAATSSWQWVDGLDLTIKAYNTANPGISTEYRPKFYGWFLGVAENGTPGGWNVEAYFWGATGSTSAAAAQASFVEVANSLPTGSGQSGQANSRGYGPTDGNSAFQNICYSSFNQISPYSGVTNYIVVFQNSSDPADIGVRPLTIATQGNFAW